MNEIQTTKEEVYRLLKKEPLTRNSDMYLYYRYCANQWVRDLDMYKVFSDPEFRKEKHISPFETVSRCRRELQNQFIELNADEKIEQMRKAREEIFNNYYGKGEEIWN